VLSNEVKVAILAGKLDSLNDGANGQKILPMAQTAAEKSEDSLTPYTPTPYA